MPDYRHASLDIALAGAHQGQRIGPEAMRLAIEHMIDVRGHHRFTLDPAAANERAIRAYERLGFKPVGLMRRYERGPDGTWHDGLLMDLLAEEYVAM
jgi:aminoglycoside 6'-N-acetyltransferase